MPRESDRLLTQTKTLLRQYGLHARKGLGQHFLINPSVLDISVSAAGLTPDDVVVEVGPGLGVLTERLAHAAKQVFAIELDARISSLLTDRFRHLPSVSIINADVLKVDIGELVGNVNEARSPTYKVVANLPYYIAAPAIRRFLEAEIKPETMVVMVQREVAENIAAAPGKKVAVR